MPQIRCSEGTGLTFNGSDNAQHMNVTLSGLLVNESFVSFQDTSVNIDECKFEGSKQGVEFVIRTKMASSIHITHSTFSRNSECISVVANSTKNSSQNIQLVFSLTNSSFDGNALSNEGRCISFIESPYTNQSVSCNVTMQSVTVSRNKFNSKGLVFLRINRGNQNINLEDVTFVGNSPLAGRHVLSGDCDSECIIDSTTVNVFINSSNFTGHNARTINVRASNISLQIYNSSFCGHRVEGNGGVISIKGTDVCNVNVSTSSFVNTTAVQGGAINIKCVNIYNVSFQENNFTGNVAKNGAGGGVFIYASGSFSNDAEYATNDKDEVNYDTQNAEQLCEINISKCNFVYVKSSSGGGAVFIKVRKVSVRLHNSVFTNCTTIRGGYEGEGGGGVFIYSWHNLLLTVDRSRFMGCGSFGAVFGGALGVLYRNQIDICIKNSHFNSNYAGFFLSSDGFGGAIGIFPLNAKDLWRKKSSHIIIEQSTISNNLAEGDGGAIFMHVNNKSILILQEVTIESNSVVGIGGAVSISGPICTIKLYQSRFLKNAAAAIMVRDVNVLEMQDSLLDSNGGALYIDCGLIYTSILIFNTTFKNCSISQEGGALYLSHRQNVDLHVKRSKFEENLVFKEFGYGAAITLSLAPDTKTNLGCIRKRLSAVDDAEKFPSWVYKSHLIFEDTAFERNVGHAAGAVYLTNGKAIFRNCTFIDNFAASLGGHIYTVPGSGSLTLHDSLFRQTLNELHIPNLNYSDSKASFCHVESSGALKVYNTTMDSSPYSSTSSLLLVRNGRIIHLGNNNLTTFICPVGSQIEILHFTDQVSTRVNNTPCIINVTTLQFSCSACAGNSYSLQRGRAIGSQLAPGFHCLPCPFGANCSRNIVAEPNFWGFNESSNPPTLKFTICPLGYCSPQKTDFPEYNGCQGNRSGELCGHCNGPYTESLYSTNCRPLHECTDYWFWPVALLYVSLMALYFTLKPPIVPWIKRQILWFTNHEPVNEDNNFDKGYLKILFYFYQAANLLFVSNSAQHIFKTKFVEPLVGLFNFQQTFSPNGLICPFPGFTVVTKQLFSASHVFGTLLMTGVFYILHWGVHKCRGQGVPSVGPYIGGVLQTMLLGYTTLASVSFNLLRCVPVGSEQRLFYNGNIVCFQWWQYILIAFICTFFVPFVFTLLWGSFKFYKKTISVGTFLLACSFPLAYLLYWTFAALFCRARNACAVDEDSPMNQVPKSSVERVLYDSFKRPGDGGKLSLSWESVMIGRRLILIVFKAFVSDPMPRLLVMSFFCVLFLLHHALTQPFRDGIVNIVETVSLLSIVLLGMINVFFASFLSLAAPLSDNFTSWWNACQDVEIVILSAVPAVFGLLVVAAALSQVYRLIVVASRFLFDLFWICFGSVFNIQDRDRRPLLVPVS